MACKKRDLPPEQELRELEEYKYWTYKNPDVWKRHNLRKYQAYLAMRIYFEVTFCAFSAAIYAFKHNEFCGDNESKTRMMRGSVVCCIILHFFSMSRLAYYLATAHKKRRQTIIKCCFVDSYAVISFFCFLMIQINFWINRKKCKPTMPVLDRWLRVEVIYQFCDILAYGFETFVIICFIRRAWVKHKRFHDLRTMLKHQKHNPLAFIQKKWTVKTYQNNIVPEALKGANMHKPAFVG